MPYEELFKHFQLLNKSAFYGKKTSNTKGLVCIRVFDEITVSYVFDGVMKRNKF